MDKKHHLSLRSVILVAGITIHQVHRTHLFLYSLSRHSFPCTYRIQSLDHILRTPISKKPHLCSTELTAHIHNRPLSSENLKAQHTDSQIRPDSWNNIIPSKHAVISLPSPTKNHHGKSQEERLSEYDNRWGQCWLNSFWVTLSIRRGLPLWHPDEIAKCKSWITAMALLGDAY